MRLIAAHTVVQSSQERNAFDQTSVPSGPQQYAFTHPDRPHRVNRNTLSQQYFAGLQWDSLFNVLEASYSILGSFIAKHSQYLLYGKLVAYLNPALFMTMANKEDNLTYREAMSGPDMPVLLQQ